MEGRTESGLGAALGSPGPGDHTHLGGPARRFTCSCGVGEREGKGGSEGDGRKEGRKREGKRKETYIVT